MMQLLHILHVETERGKPDTFFMEDITFKAVQACLPSFETLIGNFQVENET